MKVLIAGCVLLLLGTALTDPAGECEMVSFYQELGCEPVVVNVTKNDEGQVKCPRAFTCPNLHPKSGMCFHKGAAYEDKSTIPQDLIANPCSQACRCRVTDGVPSFECAAVDCVETFDGDMKEECVKIYDLRFCCSTGNICGKDAIAKLKTCQVNDKTYREGEQFRLQNTGKNCVCKGNETSDNSTDCRDINCGIEIHYQDMLYKKCAPVFTDSSSLAACPIAFQCPTSNMVVINGLNVMGVNEKCTFGSLSLSVGDDVDFEDKCTRCSCNVPPFVSCVKNRTQKCQ